jgi:hypothetical protein
MRLVKEAQYVPAGGAARSWFWPALLVAASAAGSLVFACATPFAAFAAIAAATMPRRRAVLVIAGIWLLNQGLGYGVLGYPQSADSLAWGGAMGLAAIVATLVATASLPRFAAGGWVVGVGIASVLAFAAYEAVLVAFVPVLGGASAFALPVVGEVALVNLAWLVALALAVELARLVAGRALLAAVSR